jgi:hypothetical protein
MVANSVKDTRIVASPAGRNAMPAHNAMNGQSLSQSGFFWASGQHGMPSRMSIDAVSTLTVVMSVAAIAIGVANGASISPSHARTAKKCRVVNCRCINT